MPGSTGAGLAPADREIVAEVGRRYDSNQHLSNAAEHTGALKPEFIDRFAVVGAPDACAQRLLDLAGLGLERFVITGASFRADREHRAPRRHSSPKSFSRRSEARRRSGGPDGASRFAHDGGPEVDAETERSSK